MLDLICKEPTCLSTIALLLLFGYFGFVIGGGGYGNNLRPSVLPSVRPSFRPVFLFGTWLENYLKYWLETWHMNRWCCKYLKIQTKIIWPRQIHNSHKHRIHRYYRAASRHLSNGLHLRITNDCIFINYTLVSYYNTPLLSLMNEHFLQCD